jgi:RNAse (barnase) inhibitor barstar
MAPFRLGSHDLGPSTLDWWLMLNGPVSLYLRPEYLDEDLDELRKLGYTVRSFDCSHWTTWEAAHEDLSSGFGLPESWGRNLDALRDVLTDLEVPDDGGMVVVLRAINGELDRVEPVIEALADTSRYWLLFGRRFLVLAQTTDALYRGPSDLGAMPAQWNKREWRNDARGLG